MAGAAGRRGRKVVAGRFSSAVLRVVVPCYELWFSVCAWYVSTRLKLGYKRITGLRKLFSNVSGPDQDKYLEGYLSGV